jgi:hypothetical protein
MTYACPTWEFVEDTHQMTLQRLQNRVLHITGKFPRNIPIHDMHMAFHIPYVYDRQQAQVIQSNENAHVHNNGLGKAQHRKYKRLKLCGGQACDI